MLLNQLTTYFYVRPSTVEGVRGTFYIRVTVNGKILAARGIKNIRMNCNEFDVKMQRPLPGCPVGLVCTMFMQRINERLNVMHMEHEKNGGVITKDAINKAIPGIYAQTIGEEREDLTFSGLFKQYVEDQRRQVGKTIAAGTFKTRERYKKVFEQILTNLNLIAQPVVNFTKEDVRNIQIEFMGSHARGTVVRAMFVFKSVMDFAIKKEIIDINPCSGVKRVKIEENTDVVWLDPEELEALTNLNLEGAQDAFRDAFVFCCWTGLSVGDYSLMNAKTSESQIHAAQSTKAVEPAKIVKTKEGLFLCGRRRKTGTKYRVPLLPEAKRIISKYCGLENMPYNLNSNGAVLNLMMRIIGVDKKVRFHTARKTFANYLLNERMINPVYVIEMMGWKRIEEANPYVKIKESSLYRALAG